MRETEKNLRSIIKLIFFGVVGGSIFQNATTVAGILRHLTIAGSDLNRHNIAAIVGTSGTQSLRDSGNQLTIGTAALQELLARLQLRANHVGQRLEIAEKNSLDDELTIQHLDVLGLDVAPGINLLHVVRNTIVGRNGTLLLGVHNIGNLLDSYTVREQKSDNTSSIGLKHGLQTIGRQWSGFLQKTRKGKHYIGKRYRGNVETQQRIFP